MRCVLSLYVSICWIYVGHVNRVAESGTSWSTTAQYSVERLWLTTERAEWGHIILFFTHSTNYSDHKTCQKNQWLLLTPCHVKYQTSAITSHMHNYSISLGGSMAVWARSICSLLGLWHNNDKNVIPSEWYNIRCIFMQVQQLANVYKIVFRTGCFCNIGACQKFLNISTQQLKENHKVIQFGKL